MSLRDTNPYIDSDLSLIISTFEKSMIKSEDENALLIPFRREIDSFKGVPETAIAAISAVPAFNTGIEGGVGSESSNVSLPTTSDALNDDDESLQEQQIPGEDADNNQEWINKAKQWAQECVPCDLRTITKFDPEFFKDIKGDWDLSLGDIDKSLDNFDINLLNSESVFSSLCEIASQLKGNCIPDLKKIIWLLSFLKSKLDKEFSINLNIFDNLLINILTPVFNAMLGNLDMVDTLALKPIRCVIDQLNLSVQKFQNASLSATVPAPSMSSRGINRLQEESTSAQISREEVAEASRAEQSTQSVSSFLERAKNRADFDILNGYLNTGLDYVKNYKKWIKDMIKDMVSSNTESWNKRVGLSGQKQDILRLIGLIRGIVSAAESGEFVCGVEDDGLSSEELKTLIDSYIHPNASLDVSLEDDNLVIRRNTDAEDLSAGNNELQPGESQDGNIGNGGRKVPSNIVLTKPVSSCLKNVKVEEYNQVQLWISQLEEERD